jgi:hypothetical protein
MPLPSSHPIKLEADGALFRIQDVVNLIGDVVQTWRLLLPLSIITLSAVKVHIPDRIARSQFYDFRIYNYNTIFVVG